MLSWEGRAREEHGAKLKGKKKQEYSMRRER